MICFRRPINLSVSHAHTHARTHARTHSHTHTQSTHTHACVKIWLRLSAMYYCLKNGDLWKDLKVDELEGCVRL